MDGIKGLLASRKALVAVLIVGCTFVGMYLKMIMWDDATREFLVKISVGWMGIQGAEDIVKMWTASRKPPVPAPAGPVDVPAPPVPGPDASDRPDAS